MKLFGIDFHMSVAMSVAVYFTIWWIVLFVTLPFGVRSLHETDGMTEGADPGAPVAPQMARKALWTTGISALVFAGLVAFMNFV